MLKKIISFFKKTIAFLRKCIYNKLWKTLRPAATTCVRVVVTAVVVFCDACVAAVPCWAMFIISLTFLKGGYLQAMKLKYQKPLAAIEHFELSQSIAACSIKIAFANNACVRRDVDTPDEMRSIAYNYEMYFASGCDKAGGFDVIGEYIISKDLLCYHTQTSATFTS